MSDSSTKALLQSLNRQLQGTWNQLGDKQASLIDCQRLVETINRQKVIKQVLFVCGVAIGLIVPVITIVKMYNGLPETIDYFAMGFVTMLSLVIAFGGFLMRHGSYKRMGVPNSEYIEYLLQQVNYNLRLLNMGKMFCVVIVVLFTSLSLAMLGMSVITGMSLKRPDLAGTIMAVILLCFPALYLYQRRVYNRIAEQKLQLEQMLSRPPKISE